MPVTAMIEKWGEGEGGGLIKFDSCIAIKSTAMNYKVEMWRTGRGYGRAMIVLNPSFSQQNEL